MEHFLGGMALLLDPYILWVVFAGTVIGIVVGALPGISGSTTIALMLPMTIAMVSRKGMRGSAGGFNKWRGNYPRQVLRLKSGQTPGTGQAFPLAVQGSRQSHQAPSWTAE